MRLAEAHGFKPKAFFFYFTMLLFVYYLALAPGLGHTQSLDFRGYLKSMNAVMIVPKWPEWLVSGMIHNRIDIACQPLSKLQLAVGMRNRLIYGDLLRLIPDYAEQLKKDPGYWRWSGVIADKHSHVMHSTIDRGYIDYSYTSMQLRVGRQRINWGLNLVWNPNDLFNSFSYLDFDYEERPGRDAVLITYYTGAVSFFQAAYQPARIASEAIVAGLYRWNRWGYDFQVLAGRWIHDWMLGAGWSGQLKGGAFRGEWSCFYPRDKENSRKVLVASLSADYTLRNSLYGQVSALFNSGGAVHSAGSIDYLGEQYLTAKTLTRSRLNAFLQLRYPITPLVTADISAIHNVYDHSSYVAPSVILSLSNNIDFLLIGQFFCGKTGHEYGGEIKAYFTRLKWNF